MSKANNTQSSATRSANLFDDHLWRIARDTDRMFVVLMVIQWLGAIAMALWLSPLTWIGETSQIHIHLWATIFLGGLMSGLPVILGLYLPGHWVTRHVIAVAQVGWSGLLIHLSGGRIETHFHIFGSLAFLAFYRDWKVLMTASAVVAFDHVARGYLWPLSVYGVAIEAPWRWMEHAAWVVFEDIFLVIACFKSRNEVALVCSHQAKLELSNRTVEEKVELRTSELNEAKEFFQAILDSIDSHICILDKSGTIIGTNAYWDSFAKSEGDKCIGVGFNYLEVCRNASGESSKGARDAAKAVEAVISGASNYEQFEYICDSPVGDRWFQVDITPLSSNIEGAVVVAHKNITLRVEAELQLKSAVEEARKLALVAEYTDNSVVITDPDGRIEWVNAGFSRITGHSSEQVLGLALTEILCAEEDNHAFQTIESAVLRKEGCDVEVACQRADGSPLWLSIETRPIRDASGQVIRFFSIQRDVSERKRAEQEREHLNQEIQRTARAAGMAEMATGVLHNVGNVVNSVNVSANLVLEKLGASRVTSLSKAASVITQHEGDLANFFANDKRGSHFAEMLRQLSTALETESKQQQVEVKSLIKNIEHVKETISMQQAFARVRGTREHLDPHDLFEEALKINSDSLARHDICVDKQLDQTSTVLTEKHKVLQILVNLISNAKQAICEFNGSSRSLTLSTVEADDFVQLEVIDTGMGIAAENLNKIFTHGFTTKAEGHGFGLHSAALAAQELGGSLSVFSSGIGKGARFTLRLPVSSAPVSEEVV